jgi:uncharacterized membrane protein YqjE
MAKDPSIPSLFSDVIDQVTHLFRTEVRLAKAEFSENLARSMQAGGFLIAGAVLLIGALYLLLLWLVRPLVELGMTEQWATLIVAVATALIGFLVIRKGLADLKASNLMPTRTMSSLEKDIDVAKETVG